MKKVKLEKISDDYFNGNHPNGINEGNIYEGYMIEEPRVDKSFCLYKSKLSPYFHTSYVTKELDENNTFRTVYSTYRLTILDDLNETN